jgi:hypothetical protein
MTQILLADSKRGINVAHDESKIPPETARRPTGSPPGEATRRITACQRVEVGGDQLALARDEWRGFGKAPLPGA